MTARYVRVNLAASLTGYTEKAIRHKIDQGVWVEGREYMRAPDGRLLIDMEGYNKWVAGQPQVASSQQVIASKSASHGGAENYARPSRSRRLRQT